MWPAFAQLASNWHTTAVQLKSNWVSLAVNWNRTVPNWYPIGIRLAPNWHPNGTQLMANCCTTNIDMCGYVSAHSCAILRKLIIGYQNIKFNAIGITDRIQPKIFLKGSRTRWRVSHIFAHFTTTLFKSVTRRCCKKNVNKFEIISSHFSVRINNISAHFTKQLVKRITTCDVKER